MKVLKRFWPILFIILVVAAYFWRLFFPEPKLFYTVETLGSDLWSFYYPNKDFLSHSLKSGTLPFWSKDVGTGLPLFAGGQIGSLYLPNLVLYFLFPTCLSWNLNYIFDALDFFVRSNVLGKTIGKASVTRGIRDFSTDFFRRLPIRFYQSIWIFSFFSVSISREERERTRQEIWHFFHSRYVWFAVRSASDFTDDRIDFT